MIKGKINRFTLLFFSLTLPLHSQSSPREKEPSVLPITPNVSTETSSQQEQQSKIIEELPQWECLYLYECDSFFDNYIDKEQVGELPETEKEESTDKTADFDQSSWQLFRRLTDFDEETKRSLITFGILLVFLTLLFFIRWRR